MYIILSYKGIRLDVYAKDESQTRYNVEMQVEKITQNFQILMSFLYATLTYLERNCVLECSWKE